jgi:hypothetical protein
MTKNDLIKKVTREEAEAEHSVVLGQLWWKRTVPFGHQNVFWQDLLSQMRDGDELWEYCTCQKSWEMLAGETGIALLRNGEVIGRVVTLEN